MLSICWIGMLSSEKMTIFCPMDARKNFVSGRFFIATDGVVKRSIFRNQNAVGKKSKQLYATFFYNRHQSFFVVTVI
jgi:hypothetical protein